MFVIKKIIKQDTPSYIVKPICPIVYHSQVSCKSRVCNSVSYKKEIKHVTPTHIVNSVCPVIYDTKVSNTTNVCKSICKTTMCRNDNVNTSVENVVDYISVQSKCKVNHVPKVGCQINVPNR